MIAVDTSALMAIVLNEVEADRCMAALKRETNVVISAATVAEALIVAARRGVGDVMATLIDDLGFDIQPVTPAAARRVAVAYSAWGRGARTAGLNFGDCFAYVVAKDQNCPLLYVGDDFAKTDIKGTR